MAIGQFIPITSGDVNFEGEMSFGDALVTPIITANTNNYAPLGIQNTILLNIQSSGNYTITGIVAPSDLTTKIIYIFNIGSKKIVFTDNSSSSLAENRFLLGSNKTIQED